MRKLICFLICLPLYGRSYISVDHDTNRETEITVNIDKDLSDKLNFQFMQKSFWYHTKSSAPVEEVQYKVLFAYNVIGDLWFGYYHLSNGGGEGLFDRSLETAFIRYEINNYEFGLNYRWQLSKYLREKTQYIPMFEFDYNLKWREYRWYGLLSMAGNQEIYVIQKFYVDSFYLGGKHNRFNRLVGHDLLNQEVFFGFEVEI